MAPNDAPAVLKQRGTSLLELLVALALFGIVAMATLRSLDRQARFHAGVLTMLEARTQHAAAHEAVATELRSISSRGGDIARLSDSAIVFRLPVGAGVACVLAPDTIHLAPDTTSLGQEFARFSVTPQQGDTAWIFNESASDVAADDAWVGLRVASVARAPGNCTGSPIVNQALDGGRTSWRFAVTGTLPPTVPAGAPVRLTRTARFALYRGGTGEHWLGYTEILPATSAWITIQPVSGPYLPYSAAASPASGVTVVAIDSSGVSVPVPSSASPAAIRFATRTRTSRSIRIDGLTRGLYADSLHSLIGLRNSR